MAFNSRPTAYLSEKHLKDLKDSGLTLQQAKKAGHFSADKQMARKQLSIQLPGLIFTYTDPWGVPYTRKDGTPFYRLKPDWKGIWKRSDEEPPKYLSPFGEGSRPYFSRLYPNWNRVVQSTKIDLWETEGEKKGDCGCSNDLAVLAFAGVDGWVDKNDRISGQKNEISQPLPELDAINWKGRRVNQCFDSDIVEKDGVQLALAKRASHLRQLGASPYIVRLPNEINGSKNGLDDFVVRHGIDALNKLAEVAEPTHFKEDKNGNVQLILKEPDSHLKSVMAWSVMKECWAFRPGIGWYEFTGTHWVLRKLEEFEQVLTQFMDAQHWKTRSNGTINSVVRELRSG